MNRNEEDEKKEHMSDDHEEVDHEFEPDQHQYVPDEHDDHSEQGDGLRLTDFDMGFYDPREMILKTMILDDQAAFYCGYALRDLLWANEFVPVDGFDNNYWLFDADPGERVTVGEIGDNFRNLVWANEVVFVDGFDDEFWNIAEVLKQDGKTGNMGIPKATEEETDCDGDFEMTEVCV